MDFYIATRVGALFGMDSQSEVVIVSNDQGYKAVRDYWNSCADSKKRVLISPTIGNGIVSAQKKDERTQMPVDFPPTRINTGLDQRSSCKLSLNR